jgi:hypothetical protein
MPVVGVLSTVTLDQHLLAAFRQGLAEADYVDGKNVVIAVLVSEAAGDLVRRNVSAFLHQFQMPLSRPGTQRPAFPSLR